MRFTAFSAVAVPLAMANVDTDRLIPARFLAKSRKAGLGRYLLHDLRMRPDGTENPGFILNRPAYRQAEIIVAGPNFGCGSSRENAVHALADFGMRCVVAPSFGDIFFSNCFKNSILAVRLDPEMVSALQKALLASPSRLLAVDPEAQTLRLEGGPALPFALDPFCKEMLIEGIDEIDFTLRNIDAVAAYEAATGK